VRVGESGIGVDQSGHHREVLRDTVRILFAQCLQLGSGDAIEILRLHIIRNHRIVMTGAHRLGAEGVTVFDLLGRSALVARTGPALAGVPRQVCIRTGALRPVPLRISGPWRPTSSRCSALRATAIRTCAGGPLARAFGAISEVGHELPLDLSSLVKLWARETARARVRWNVRL